jgi:hypothetical protein
MPYPISSASGATPSSSALALLVTMSAAVGDLRRVARRDRAVLGEGGTQCRERLGGSAGPDTLVGVDDDRVALALLDRHRRDLVGEATFLLGGRGALVRLRRELVLRLTRDVADLADVILGARAHVQGVEGAPQAVADHRVDDLVVAHAVAGARPRQQVRRVGHRLHAARDHDFGVAVVDHLVGEVQRVDAGEAHLVQRRRGNRHRDAGLDRGLPRGDLTRARLQHLTHEYVVDLLGVDAGPLERGLDREPAELHRRHAGERAGELADGSAGRPDDHRTGHGSLLEKSVTKWAPV